MKPYQHFWGMTAILSALLLGNLFVSRTRAQEPVTVPNVITAREIQLVNEAGLVRMKLSAEVNGVSQIQLFNPEGKRQLELSVDGYDRQPSVKFYDESERLRLSLTQSNYKYDAHAPQIEMFDGADTLIGNFGINPNGKADLYLRGIEGHSMTLKPESLFFQRENSTKTALFPYQPGSPGLAFADENGKYIWTAPPKNKSRR